MNRQKKSAFAAQTPEGINPEKHTENCFSILSMNSNSVKSLTIPGLDHDCQSGKWVATSYWKEHQVALMRQTEAKKAEARIKRAAKAAIGGGAK